ncbi:hypothetical protein [Sphingomonas sp. PAMC 26605]|uniref:hypothetical protein n=1 Tax=Sphingomonas sp. PAMC 26605 TaxID=1112214 RepID=UPI0012F4EA1B|nr:hypothetical protein [Sphingomonas sp. PAMC 26605]
MRPAPLLCGLFVAAMPLAVVGADAQQRDSLGHVITQPLRDTRLTKTKIPPILQRAASAPYSSEHTQSCATIAAEVRQLDSALGADVDVPGKRKGEGSEIAAVAARTAVGTLIPGLGLVRVITGADKEQRRAEAAVYAGQTRRAFLKGLGFARKCQAPAAPTRAAVTDMQSSN